MDPMKLPTTAALLLILAGAAHASTATFDDLASPPALTGATGLQYANNGSASYAGVVWDTRFEVVGDGYRVAVDGPLFGSPASGHYAVTNATADVGGVASNDGLLLTTALVLTSARFGQNEYYGYGGGADRITVSALRASTVLGSVTLDLPDANPGQPEPLQLLDTSAFLALSGITGYRIDRHAPSVYRDSWVGDNFVFQSPVPEVSAAGLLTLGLGTLVLVVSPWRRASASRHSPSA
jgi:hypothetical protein